MTGKLDTFNKEVKYKFFRGCVLNNINIKAKFKGPVVELADTLDLGSSAERCEGSSPFRPTKKKI